MLEGTNINYTGCQRQGTSTYSFNILNAEDTREKRQKTSTYSFIRINAESTTLSTQNVSTNEPALTRLTALMLMTHTLNNKI